MDLRGRLVQPLHLAGFTLAPGPVRCQVRFDGGSQPSIDQVTVTGNWSEGSVLRATPSSVELDGQRVTGSVRAGRLVQRVVEALWDLQADAWALADHEVQVGLGRGLGRRVELGIPSGACVRLRGESLGPPSKLVLAAPLSVSVGGAWIRLGGDRRVRWLSSLARVRVERAVLHPDGRVALDGGARRLLNRAARGGLAHASDRISDLVRHSPHFGRVRTFLPG